MIHISPETNCIGKIFPHAFIFPYGFFTFLNKRLDTVFFDLLFSVQSKHLFNFQLNR